MDLAGPFINPKRPNVPVEPLNSATLYIPLRPEDLHYAISHSAVHFGSEVLAYRDIHRDVLAAIALSRGLDDQGPRSLDLDLAFGKHRLHQLELGNRLAKLLPPPGVGDCLIEHANGGTGAQRRQINALLVQRLHHSREAAPRQST